MRKSGRLIAFVLWLVAAPALAHGPTPKKVEETVTIAADAARVWAVIADFGALAAWHPMVASSEAGDGNQGGSERIVALKSGGTITDSLDSYDAGAMSYSYRLLKENVEAFPVSFYSAEISVAPAGDGAARVTWVGRFYRGDTGNFPADGLDDEAAVAAMTGFFQSGLAGLKQRVESRP